MTIKDPVFLLLLNMAYITLLSVWFVLFLDVLLWLCPVRDGDSE